MVLEKGAFITAVCGTSEVNCPVIIPVPAHHQNYCHQASFLAICLTMFIPR